MAKENNPAGRLFSVLDSVRKFHNPNAPMKSVWPYVLSDARLHTPVNTWRQFGVLLGLIEEGRKWIEESEVGDKSIYLKPFEDLGKLFESMNLEETCESWKRKIDEPTMIALQFCSDYFSTSGREDEIDRQTLQDIQLELQELIENVHDSALSDDFRIMLIESLEEIRRAILEYRLRGAAGLREAMERGVGGILRFRSEIAEINDVESDSVVQKWFALLSKLDSMASAALKVRQLVSPLTNLVLPGSTE